MDLKKTITIIILTSTSMLYFSNQCYSQSNRQFLTSFYQSVDLKAMLISRDDFHPFPTGQEREAWQSLPGVVRRQLIAHGEKYLNFQYPVLPATLFLDFIRTGNREKFQGQRDARRDALRDLVLAECAEGQGRFLDDIVNGIWVICEETYWGVPAHLSLQARGLGLPDVNEPTVDLFAGETGSLLAWTSYLLGEQLDTVSPLIQQRIQSELEKKILNTKPLLK